MAASYTIAFHVAPFPKCILHRHNRTDAVAWAWAMREKTTYRNTIIFIIIGNWNMRCFLNRSEPLMRLRRRSRRSAQRTQC